MRRGPKPKPTRLHILDGTRPRHPADREPQPARGVPTRPEWLSTEAKAEWTRIAGPLDRLGLLCTVDRAALAAYCQAYAELKLATETLAREGRFYRTALGMIRPHPAVAQQRSAMTLVRNYLSEFGLSPASRSGIVTPAADDPLDEFLKEDAGG